MWGEDNSTATLVDKSISTFGQKAWPEPGLKDVNNGNILNKLSNLCKKIFEEFVWMTHSAGNNAEKLAEYQIFLKLKKKEIKSSHI